LPPRKKAAKKNPGTEELMQDPNVKSQSTQSDSAKSESSKSSPTASSSTNSPNLAASATSKQQPAESSASKPNAAPSSAPASKTQAPPIEATVPEPNKSANKQSTNSKDNQSQHHGDDIHARTAHRAYLNFLDRQQNSHHGDAHSDWVRAEQQIHEEQERGQAPTSQKAQPENPHQSQGVRKDDAYKSAKA
jgi:hypothetical protein